MSTPNDRFSTHGARRKDVAVSLGVFAVSTGLFAWVAQRWIEVTGGSWPASVFLGAWTASIVALAISACLAGLRYLRTPAMPKETTTTPAAPAVAVDDQGPRPATYSPVVPLVDMELDLTQVTRAAPWLQFHCMAYNATGCNIRLKSAQGRIRIGPQQLHDQPELGNVEFSYSEGFLTFSIKVALSATEAGYVHKLAEDERMSITFSDASIEIEVHTQPLSISIRTKLPGAPLQFLTRGGRPAPAFVRQVMQ